MALSPNIPDKRERQIQQEAQDYWNILRDQAQEQYDLSYRKAQTTYHDRIKRQAFRAGMLNGTILGAGIMYLLMM